MRQCNTVVTRTVMRQCNTVVPRTVMRPSCGSDAWSLSLL